MSKTQIPCKGGSLGESGVFKLGGGFIQHGAGASRRWAERSGAPDLVDIKRIQRSRSAKARVARRSCESIALFGTCEYIQRKPANEEEHWFGEKAESCENV